MISRRLQIAGVRPPPGPALKADACVTGVLLIARIKKVSGCETRVFVDNNYVVRFFLQKEPGKLRPNTLAITWCISQICHPTLLELVYK